MANMRSKRAAQALRALVKQIEDDSWDQEPARVKENLVARLKSFAAFLSLEDTRAVRLPKKSPSLFLTRIAARKLGASEDRYVLISTSEILYLFLGHAVSGGLISAPSIGQLRFRNNSVYLRTTKGVFVTHYSTLKELRDGLDPQLFSPVHKSIVVNIQKIVTVDFSRNHKQIGFTVSDASLETVIVSRRYFKDLRTRLGFPNKSRSRQGVNQRDRLRMGNDR